MSDSPSKHEDSFQDDSTTDLILERHGIDPILSRKVLQRVRSMDADSARKANTDEIRGFPAGNVSSRVSTPKVESSQNIDDDNSGEHSHEHKSESAYILDLNNIDDLRVETDYLHVAKALSRLELPAGIESELWKQLGAKEQSGRMSVDARALEIIGIAALPRVSYGVLNGGSATSYADEKKNRSFNRTLFELYSGVFSRQAGKSRGRAKGLTPGYLNPDGTPGYSFMELKIRAALLLLKKHDELFPSSFSLHQDDPERWPRPLFLSSR